MNRQLIIDKLRLNMHQREQFMKVLILFFALFHSFSAMGQEKELTLQIGDTIQFKTSCDSGAFNFIDLYTKTRYLDSVLRYDTSTGTGFYNSFFFDGDISAERLPCSYHNQKFTITSVQTFVDKNTGEDRLVVFVLLEKWNKVAWLEFIDAYESGEAQIISATTK